MTHPISEVVLGFFFIFFGRVDGPIYNYKIQETKLYAFVSAVILSCGFVLWSHVAGAFQ